MPKPAFRDGRRRTCRRRSRRARAQMATRARSAATNARHRRPTSRAERGRRRSRTDKGNGQRKSETASAAVEAGATMRRTGHRHDRTCASLCSFPERAAHGPGCSQHRQGKRGCQGGKRIGFRRRGMRTDETPTRRPSRPITARSRTNHGTNHGADHAPYLSDRRGPCARPFHRTRWRCRPQRRGAARRRVAPRRWPCRQRPPEARCGRCADVEADDVDADDVDAGAGACVSAAAAGLAFFTNSSSHASVSASMCRIDSRAR